MGTVTVKLLLELKFKAEQYKYAHEFHPYGISSPQKQVENRSRHAAIRRAKR
jgi:hypothetical protein